ncbi:NAD-dependent epimerase/dehydratase family protein [Streptomyces lavendulae]|uniref:NAD-dependent epimerase/dehydratase family protein n=1 Tax=Streptomyces lavendulae TaxID=1914 RepID=UPI0033E30AA7
MSGLRVAVTGASGFVGRHLCRRIVGAGGQVVAVVRAGSPRAGLPEAAERVVEVDWDRGAGAAEAVAGVDVVIHLAAVLWARSWAEFERGNVGVTRTLAQVVAQASARTGAASPRLVVCSSLAAAGPEPGTGLLRCEEDEPAPVSWYGRSKLAAERAAAEVADRVAVVVVRPPIVYGAGDRAFVPSVARMARTGLVLQPGRVRRQYAVLHVNDVCDALVAAAVRGQSVVPGRRASGLYHLADERQFTMPEIVGVAAAALGGRAPRVLPVPLPLVRAVAAAGELGLRPLGRVPLLSRDKAREAGLGWTASARRAHAELGFVPRVGFEAGLGGAVREWAAHR